MAGQKGKGAQVTWENTGTDRGRFTVVHLEKHAGCGYYSSSINCVLWTHNYTKNSGGTESMLNSLYDNRLYWGSH